MTTQLSALFTETAPERFEAVKPPQRHPYAAGDFMVRPVFGGQGLECAPEHELLSVVLVNDGVVTPVDCVPMKDFKGQSVEMASKKLTQAFTRALNRMNVTFAESNQGQMAGWHIKARGADQEVHTLEFIREGFGVERVREVLLSRAREHTHHDLKLQTGPDYWAFCIRALRPF